MSKLTYSKLKSKTKDMADEEFIKQMNYAFSQGASNKTKEHYKRIKKERNICSAVEPKKSSNIKKSDYDSVRDKATSAAKKYGYDSNEHLTARLECYRMRSAIKGMECDLTETDLLYYQTITHCQYTGVKFTPTLQRTLDRIEPSIGYVKSNIAVCSVDANRAKEAALENICRKLTLVQLENMCNTLRDLGFQGVKPKKLTKLQRLANWLAGEK